MSATLPAEAPPAPAGRAPLRPAGRLLMAGVIAVALVLGVNAGVGARLPVLLQEADVRYGDELARRAAALPHPEAVQVLLLGNSHVLAGLRPPDVAAAFGLTEGAAFSLALPGSTALEQAVLFARHRSRFPGLRAVVVGLDEFLFTARFEVNVRYLTRGSHAERWRWARRFPEPDRRLSLAAVRLFPLMDFKNPLADAWAADRGRFVRRLAADEPDPTSAAARTRAQAWPWGMPPPWDAMDAKELAELGAARSAATAVNQRAERFLPEGAETDVANGLADLEALLGELDALGLPVALAELPYDARVRSAMARLTAGRDQRYREALAAFLARTGRALVPPPTGLTTADFVDPDHLARPGARKMAGWLAARLQGTPVGGALRR